MRQKGRTIGMLTEANAAYKAGKEVWIVAAHVGHVYELGRQCRQLGLEIPFKRIVTAAVVDPVRGRPKGVSFDAEVFIDHFAAESQIQEIDEKIKRLTLLRQFWAAKESK